MDPDGPTVHASAVLVGARAVLIRGPAGAGKSRLALSLIEMGRAGYLSFTKLVSDDRTVLQPANGRLLASPPAKLAGLLEVRGLGIRRLPYERWAVVGWVVDLGEEAAERLPSPQRQLVTIASVTLPRIAIRPCADARAVLLAALLTAEAGEDPASPVMLRCGIDGK
jgi:serine kinase of HPr protein (carbohydrate metabolism regulator)